MAARRFAIQTETLGGAGSYSANLQLTTSVGLFWQQNLDTLTNAVAPLYTIGSSFDPLNLPASYDTSEDALTVTPNFYGAPPRLYGLSLLTSPDQFNSNIVALRRDQSPGATLLPNYTLASWKLDRANLAAQQAAPITITVDATIYAQTGSWFVVPVPMEDLTNVTNPSTQHQIRRLNYKLVVKGSISENFTPQAITENYAAATGYAVLPGATNGELDPDNNPRGAMGQWLDAASYPLTQSGGLGTTWQSVVYEPSTQKQSVTDTNMLYLPITPDITLQR